jgi:hypothetical protein
MNTRRLFALAAVLLPFALSGCLAPAGDEPVAEDGEALRGDTVNANSVVLRVVVAGSNRVWNGTLVEPDLVLVAGDLPTSTSVLDITAQLAVDAAHPTGLQTRLAGNFLHNALFNVALIKLQQPFNVPQGPLAFDSRSPATLNGVVAACQGYRAGTNEPKGFTANVANATATGFTLFSPSAANVGIDPGDLAVPCFDLSANDGFGTLLGVSGTRVNALGQQEAYVIPAAPLASWIPIAKEIFDIERLARRYSYYATPFQVVRLGGSFQTKCMDLPDASPVNGTPINQFFCHWGINQHWVRDLRVEPLWAPFVSNATGKCLTMVNDGPGPVVEQPCNGSDRQKFREDWVGNGQTQYVSRVGYNLCLSATGGLQDGVGLSVQACGASIFTTTQVWSRHP